MTWTSYKADVSGLSDEGVLSRVLLWSFSSVLLCLGDWPMCPLCEHHMVWSSPWPPVQTGLFLAQPWMASICYVPCLLRAHSLSWWSYLSLYYCLHIFDVLYKYFQSRGNTMLFKLLIYFFDTGKKSMDMVWYRFKWRGYLIQLPSTFLWNEHFFCYPAFILKRCYL